MKKNIGFTDKAIRIILAITIGSLYFTNVINGTTAILLGIVAAVLLVTSFVSFCPLYAPFGISSRKNTNNQ